MDHKGNAVDEHFTIQDLKTAAMADTRDAEDVVITTTSGEIPDRNSANCMGIIIRKRPFSLGNSHLIPDGLCFKIKKQKH